MRILITGASGQVGAYVVEELLERGHEILAWSGSETCERSGVQLEPIDLTNREMLQRALDRARPDAIMHAAAVSSAAAVRNDPERAHAINVQATRQLAAWAEARTVRLVFTSTDLVFDGSRPWNREDDPAAPILAYGQSKLEAERSVLECSGGIVARLALLYGPSKCDRPYFFDDAVEAIRSGNPRSFFEDEFRTPLDLATAARTLVDLAESNLAGLFHVAGLERISRFELMDRAIRALGLDPSLVRKGRRADVPMFEPRPADVSLDTGKLAAAWPRWDRPTIEQALEANRG